MDMDLSQQELPLETYFSKPRVAPKKKRVPTDSSSQSVPRPSKRRKSAAQRSVASPLNSTAGQSKLRPTTLQLPTPATSARKCVRDRRRLEESRAEVRLGVATGQNAIRTSERDAALESGASSSRLRQLRRESTEDAVLELSNVPLPTPSAGRHKPGKLNSNEFHPSSRQSDYAVTAPQASSRSESVHDADGHFPLVGPSRRLFSQPSRPLYQGPPCSPIGSASSDPFYTRQDVRVFAPRDSVYAPSEALDGQPSFGPVLPMLPIPSSQSQYLLHPDATPTRKRYYRRVEYVVSSQLLEEEELMLPRLPKPTKDISSVVVSPGKHTPQSHRGCGERRSQRFHMGFRTPVASSTNSSAGLSCASAVTSQATDKLSPGFSNSPRCKRSTTYHSPSSKPMRGSICQGPAENIPLGHPEDSLTESESDSAMLRLKMKAKSSSSCSPTRGSGRDKLSSREADSATEAESDTEIRHCVEQISKKRRSEHHLGGLRENTPPPLVISPLVSPAKSRIAAVSPIDGFTESPTRKGFRSRIQGSGYPSTVEHRMQPESLPSVVREFIRMFPGDESYPASFPESLRI